jgi:hypothetical protein
MTALPSIDAEGFAWLPEDDDVPGAGRVLCEIFTPRRRICTPA